MFQNQICIVLIIIFCSVFIKIYINKIISALLDFKKFAGNNNKK